MVMRLFILICFFSSPALAQNLLMNEGFEEENICTEYIKNCAPEGWISTSLTSNYYFDDVKHAFEGQHFVGLMVRDRPSRPKFYLRSRLLCALRSGMQYRLKFQIRSVHSVLDSIGIYFSEDDILYRKGGLKTEQPRLWVKDGIESGEKGSWQSVDLLFTADGSEGYISIGDFKTGVHNIPGRPDLGKDFYFFIDAISLMPVNKNERICSQADSVREVEYENNERHGMLEKKVYVYSRNLPQVQPLPATILQRIDTLVLPDVFFATNSYELNRDAFAVLDSFVISSQPFIKDSLVIEGHTDSTGSVPLNQKLSANRAASVAGYLQKNISAPLITRGWASERPPADNRSREGRRKNRRVELYLYVRE